MPIRAAVLLALVAACSTPPADVAPPTPVGITAGDSLAALSRPAVFSGDLPCADCEAIATTIELRPDGTARVRDQYRGARVEGTGTFDRLARWTLDGDRLTIAGATELYRQFRRTDEQTLTLLDQQGAPITSGANLALRRVAVAPAWGAREFVGEFRYLADAASLTDCDAGIQFPVAADSAYLTLERLYSSVGMSGGAPMRVRVTARTELRPAMEGDAQVETMVIEQAAVAEPSARCAVSDLRDQVAGAPWTLAVIGADTVRTPVSGGEAPTLSWDASESRLAGTAGCNRYTGRGTLRGNALVPAPLAMTRRMCVSTEVMAREARVGAVLGAGGWLTIRRDTLFMANGITTQASFVRR